MKTWEKFLSDFTLAQLENRDIWAVRLPDGRQLDAVELQEIMKLQAATLEANLGRTDRALVAELKKQLTKNKMFALFIGLNCLLGKYLERLQERQLEDPVIGPAMSDLANRRSH